jgi:hypothetical protein
MYTHQQEVQLLVHNLSLAFKSLADSCCICNTLSMSWHENRKSPTGLVKHFTSIDMDSRNYNEKAAIALRGFDHQLPSLVAIPHVRD